MHFFFFIILGNCSAVKKNRAVVSYVPLTLYYVELISIKKQRFIFHRNFQIDMCWGSSLHSSNNTNEYSLSSNIRKFQLHNDLTWTSIWKIFHYNVSNGKAIIIFLNWPVKKITSWVWKEATEALPAGDKSFQSELEFFSNLWEYLWNWRRCQFSQIEKKLGKIHR